VTNPSLQRDDVFLLTNGRDVLLESLRVTGTFRNFLEGAPEVCSEVIRKGWREKEDLRGWQVVDLHGAILPPFQCTASFRSFRPTRVSEWDYSSLDVCWYVERLDVNLRDLVANVLPHVDWENRAIDGTYDDW
jgi:hypothetical protein